MRPSGTFSRDGATLIMTSVPPSELKENKLMCTLSVCAAAGLGVLAFPLAALAGPGPVSVDLIIKSGDPVPDGSGTTVDILNAPFTNSNGQVGFVGSRSDGVRFIWFDDGVVFTADEALPTVLSGGEGTMGVSNAGGFIYSPSIDGDDGVWGQDGLILVETNPAPGTLDDFISFCSRPQMLPDGTTAWVSGLTDTKGGSSQGRALYQRSPVGDFTIILQTGQDIGGETIDFPAGVQFSYKFADNNEHHIQELLLDTGATNNDNAIYVDGVVVVQELDPIDESENWDNFDAVTINNDGDYLFSGDTDGDSASDEFIAYNNVITVREGDVIDGFMLGSSVRDVQINNHRRVAFVWGGGLSDPEGLLVGQATALCAAHAVLQVGDAIDVDNDMIADFVVDDFNASNGIGPGLDFSDDDFVHVEVDLLDLAGGDVGEAILRVPLPKATDLDGDGTVGPGDLAILLASWGDEGCLAGDIDADGDVDPADLAALLADWD